MLTKGGFRSKLANCESFTGYDMLQKSFDPMPMINSLMSGLPSRCTCWKGPLFFSGLEEFRIVTRLREVVPQTPIVALGEVAGSMFPVLVSMVIGTWMAMAFTA